MADLPPLPPGFTLDAPRAAPGRPIIRRGPDMQAKTVQDGQLIDPNTGTATPIRGFQPKANSKTADEAALDKINLRLKQQELADKRAKAQSATKDIGNTAADLRNVIDSAFRAKELSRNGWLATGFGASLAQKVGGTSAADIKGLLDTIGSNTAFERLQKMRDESPTGGALGNITERELDLLKSTIASLDQSQSDDQFQGAMQRIAETYGRVLAKIPGGRAMMIERGWLPKSSKAQPKPKQQAKPMVVDFNDLPE